MVSTIFPVPFWVFYSSAIDKVVLTFSASVSQCSFFHQLLNRNEATAV